MNRNLSFFYFIFLFFLLLAVFQNCGPGSSFRLVTDQESSDSMAEPSREFPFVLEGQPTPSDTPINEQVSSEVEIQELQVSGGPGENQIVQRLDMGSVQLDLKVSAFPAATRVIRFQLKSDGETINSSPFSADQNLKLRFMPKPGKMQLTLQSFDQNGFQNGQWKSFSFLMGDIFIVAGQSNAAVHGQSAQRSVNSSNQAFSFANRQWVALQDPLPLASNWQLRAFGGQPQSGGSIWPVFADLWNQKTQRPVGIVNVAWGGSSVAEWLAQVNSTYRSETNSNEPLVARLIRVTQALGNCNFKAVLWHQGESDSISGTSTAQYKARMQDLRNQFIQATGCRQPWVLAKAGFVPLSSFDIPESQIMQIRQAQYELIDGVNFLNGPDTDYMTASRYRYDSLHFSNEGLKLHADLWVNKLSALESGRIDQSEYQMIPEYKAVADLYGRILKRSLADTLADHNGLFYHSSRYQRGEQSLAQLEQVFRNSDEFFIVSQFERIHNKVPLLSERLQLIGKIENQLIRNRQELQVYIEGFYNRKSSAGILGDVLKCTNYANANERAIASWYLADTGRCADLGSLIYWQAELIKSNLSLAIFKSRVWDTHPAVVSIRNCLGSSNPSDQRVTECYRMPNANGDNAELCSKGSPWLHRRGTTECYLP